MRVAVHYGSDRAEFDLAEDRSIPVSGGSHPPRVVDVASAVAEAVERPRAFPPLRQAIVPGDHVALVLDESIPHPGKVLDPVIECLADAGVSPYDIRIVQVSRREDGSHRLTPDNVPPGITLVDHDARDRNKLSYLASTKAGTRVYLNREVVDADLVVLVGRVDYHPILGYRGPSAGVFPGVADAAAQQEFLGNISSADDIKTRTSMRRESDEVAWLLGVQFAVQVVVGDDNEVVDVFAGRWMEVQEQAQAILDQCWRRTVPRRAELVVAAIGGDAGSQGFEELGMALANARSLVVPGGRIAVLSSIAASPGASLGAARELQNPVKSLETLRRHPGRDAISTWQILQACQHARVYLLSRLDGGLVEELFMIPLTSVRELQRIIDQSGSCIVLNDAALVRATVEDPNA